MIKLIVSDLDGTMIDDRNQCHPDTVREISRLKSLGAKFAICTGRPIDAMLSLIDGWNLREVTDYVIGSNGGEIIELATGIRNHKAEYMLSPELMIEIIDLYEPLGVVPTLYRGRDLYVQKMTNQIESVSRRVNIVPHLADVRSMITGPEIKEMFVFDPSLMEVVELFAKEHPDPRYICFKTAHDIVEVTHSALGKHVGIEMLAQMLNIDYSEIIAFGDTTNDITMLKRVKYGICVASGTQDAKEIAFDIALPMQEQGVAKYLETHLQTLEYK